MSNVAALFIRDDGPYVGRPDVDPWHLPRDAREYAGPAPVVAHPPCQRWGNLWWSARHLGKGLGDDDGCFASALASVRRWGGVIEHPEGSRAWAHFGLPKPSTGRGWSRSLLDPGWSCVVDQGRYGHAARKRSWLYYVGDAPPPEIDWAPCTDATAIVVSGPGFATPEERAAKGVRLLGKREKELTPPAFAEVLIALARASRAP